MVLSSHHPIRPGTRQSRQMDVEECYNAVEEAKGDVRIKELLSLINEVRSILEHPLPPIYKEEEVHT
jgi:hypothetical protein